MRKLVAIENVTLPCAAISWPASGAPEEAAQAFDRAADLTANSAEERHLRDRARACV